MWKLSSLKALFISIALCLDISIVYTTYLAYRALCDSVDQAVNSFVIANVLNKKEF